MGEKADSELVRRQNRRIVLDALRQSGAMARVELGRLTGLSPASITAISAQLIDENVIHEINNPPNVPSSGKRGRPIVRLDLKPDAAFVVAAKVSIDDVEILIADFRGITLARTKLRLSTFAQGRQEFGKILATEMANFVIREGLTMARIARIGVAVQGLADKKQGRIVWSPAFSVRDIAVAETIEADLGVPCMVANDANMIAEGLVALDQQRYGGITLAIFTGYGVGMGLIIDGNVYHGATGAASEFGHMNHLPNGATCRCGRKGCIEAYVADYGILRLAQGDVASAAPHAAVPETVLEDLIIRAKAGEAKAQNAFDQAGTALGYGLARLIAILNPNRIVFAGPGIATVALMEAAMHRALDDAIVEDLRRDITIESTTIDNDMIMRGTVGTLLRAIDRNDFAPGQTNRVNT